MLKSVKHTSLDAAVLKERHSLPVGRIQKLKFDKTVNGQLWLNSVGH